MIFPTGSTSYYGLNNKTHTCNKQPIAGRLIDVYNSDMFRYYTINIWTFKDNEKIIIKIIFLGQSSLILDILDESRIRYSYQTIFLFLFSSHFKKVCCFMNLQQNLHNKVYIFFFLFLNGILFFNVYYKHW